MPLPENNLDDPASSVTLTLSHGRVKNYPRQRNKEDVIKTPKDRRDHFIAAYLMM